MNFIPTQDNHLEDAEKEANKTALLIKRLSNCTAGRENSREYTLLKTEKFGTVLMMEVGAMMVGKITNVEKKSVSVKKGQEKSRRKKVERKNQAISQAG